MSERNTLQGVKVLVIDDSNTLRRSAEIFLLQAGCTVILAEDGFDALAKIADHQPNIVFVDIMQGILQITEETTEGTKQTNVSISQLTKLAAELRSSVAGFKV